jgi:hypothetical protein
MKLSFDFDSTLDRPSVQMYAKQLMDDGHEVWICTTRTSPETHANPSWNDDLFLVSDKLGIPRSQIIFTNHELKYDFLKDKGFLWHLDDDWIELNELNRNTDIRGISVWGQTNWKKKCDKLLKQQK